MIGIHRAVTDAQKNTMLFTRNVEDRDFKIKNHFELLPIKRSEDKLSYKISKFIDYAPFIFLKIRFILFYSILNIFFFYIFNYFDFF